jgi:hypothetical protein
MKFTESGSEKVQKPYTYQENSKNSSEIWVVPVCRFSRLARWPVEPVEFLGFFVLLGLGTNTLNEPNKLNEPKT